VDARGFCAGKWHRDISIAADQREKALFICQACLSGKANKDFLDIWFDAIVRKKKHAKKSDPAILKVLEELYEKERKIIVPLYPYNKETGKIELPEDVIADLKFFLLVGNKPAAVKRVVELTGASLRMSKDYVDNLQRDHSI
jgi:hypothetical protein